MTSTTDLSLTNPGPVTALIALSLFSFDKGRFVILDEILLISHQLELEDFYPSHKIDLTQAHCFTKRPSSNIMPPSVVPCSPSGPEVDSQYSSGSESQSVHIVAHHPQSESGQGINSEKRKAELVEANDNRAFKAPRSEYHRSHPSKSELDDYKDEDQDDDDDDDDGDEEEEDEDDEEQDGHDDGTPADVGSVNQLFPGPNEPVSGRTTPSAPALHPSLTVPKSGWYYEEQPVNPS